MVISTKITNLLPHFSLVPRYIKHIVFLYQEIYEVFVVLGWFGFFSFPLEQFLSGLPGLWEVPGLTPIYMC